MHIIIIINMVHVIIYYHYYINSNIHYIVTKLTIKNTLLPALDPAGPAFENENPITRLDRTDAQFVDTIHTDGFELGLGYDVSHSDFYPNKGLSPQPPCEGGREYFVT